MVSRKGVVGIVYRYKKDPEFLLLHRQRDWKGWEFSKGELEECENEEDALVRELEEETGLTDVKIRSKIPLEIEYKYGKNKKHLNNFDGAKQSVFLVESFKSDVKTSEEHDDFKWVDYRTALKLLKHENQRKALSESMQLLL